MLKIIYRSGLIILAALIVSGALFLYANQAGSGLTSLPGGAERPQLAASDGTTSGGEIRAERHEREDGFSINGLAGVLGQLGKIGVITLIVVGIQALYRRVRRQFHPAGSPSPEAP